MILQYQTLKGNPFSPRRPVAAELFVGRQNELNTLNEAAQSALNQNSTEIVIITGPRGVGKTNLLQVSFADASKHWSGPQLASQLITIQRGLGKSTSNDVISAIVSATLNAVAPHSIRYRISRSLQHVLSRFTISFGGYSVEAKEAKLQHLFGLLKKVSNLLRRSRPPLLLTLVFDEADRLLEDYPEFAEFLRQMLETLDSSLLFIISGLPITWGRLISGHPSIQRSARRIKLQPLHLEQVQELISRSINLANTVSHLPIQVEGKFANTIFDLSGGHPYLVHLLGDHCYKQLSPENGEAGMRFGVSMLTNGGNHLAQRFAEDVFEPWIGDLGQLSKRILPNLVMLRGSPRGRAEIIDYLATGHDKSEIRSLLAELEEWGIVNSDLQIVSIAFAKWLRQIRLDSEEKGT